MPLSAFYFSVSGLLSPPLSQSPYSASATTASRPFAAPAPLCFHGSHGTSRFKVVTATLKRVLADLRIKINTDFVVIILNDTSNPAIRMWLLMPVLGIQNIIIMFDV